MTYELVSISLLAISSSSEDSFILLLVKGLAIIIVKIIEAITNTDKNIKLIWRKCFC